MHAPDARAGGASAAGAGAGRDLPGRTRLGRLADEQAALRRVATLVSTGAQPGEVFSAVADELGHLIGAEATFVTRVDHLAGERGKLEEEITVVGSYGRVSDEVPIGFRIKLQPGMVHTAALQRGCPARVSGENLAAGPFGAIVGKLGVRAAVATPILVRGRTWGVTVAATAQADFPPGTESRMANFMELAGTAVANAQADQDLRELADTQAALRRLATLVARGESPDAVFAAATREALRHSGGGVAGLVRYEPDGTATLVAREDRASPGERAGQPSVSFAPAGLTEVVLRTGQAARADDYQAMPVGERFSREGLRCAVGTPIHVNGRLWGLIAVGSREGPLPPGTEQRMTDFTDLVATAVANAQNRAALQAGRDELARLLAEQAALRRVATLVARESEPAEIFLAVAEETRRLLGADDAGIARFDADGSSVVAMGGGGDVPHGLPAGTRVKLGDYTAPAVVWRTGRPAQVDEDAWISRPDGFARALREMGVRSMMASPVVVEGRLWGVVNALSTRGPFPAGVAHRMAAFTELVATAVGNAESRAELAASRARIVAADAARRRIERDLHDGTQQRLVSLGLQLRLAQSQVPAGLSELREEVGRVAGELTGVVEELREIARGIHPVILSEGGLELALRTLARRAAVAVELDVGAVGRLAEPVEVAAYYLVCEALTNASRRARASVVHVACGGFRWLAAGARARRRHWRRGSGAGVRAGRAAGPDRGTRRPVRPAQPGRRRYHHILRTPCPRRLHATSCRGQSGFEVVGWRGRVHRHGAADLRKCPSGGPSLVQELGARPAADS